MSSKYGVYFGAKSISSKTRSESDNSSDIFFLILAKKKKDSIFFRESFEKWNYISSASLFKCQS